MHVAHHTSRSAPSAADLPATEAASGSGASAILRTHQLFPATFFGRMSVNAPKGSTEIIRSIRMFKESPPADGLLPTREEVTAAHGFGAARKVLLCVPRLAAGQVQLRDPETLDVLVFININRIVTSSKLDDCIGFTTHARHLHQFASAPLTQRLTSIAATRSICRLPR